MASETAILEPGKEYQLYASKDTPVSPFSTDWNRVKVISYKGNSWYEVQGLYYDGTTVKKSKIYLLNLNSVASVVPY